MKHFRNLLAAVAAILASASPAAADPISSAVALVAGLVGGGGLFAGASGALLQVGLGLALSLGSSLLFGRTGSGRAGAPSGVQRQLSFGGDQPRQIVVGQLALYGQQICAWTYGATNDKMVEIIQLSDWFSDSLTGVRIDGKAVTLTQIPVVDNEASRWRVDGYYSGGVAHIEIAFFDGTQTAAPASLVANAPDDDIGAGKMWTANHIGFGCTYVAVISTYKAQLWESGFKRYKFTIRGAKLYDWRKDTTAGGSGSHRWDDPATWEWSNTPEVVLYNYLRGFYLNDDLLLGEGVSAADLVNSSFTTAANVSEELVSLAAGGSEPRYRISMNIEAGVDHRSNIEAILAASAGHLVESVGQFVCIAGAAYATVRTFGDDDLIAGEPVEFSQFESRDSLFNRVDGQFLDPGAGFVSASYTSQTNADYVSDDGGIRPTGLDLTNVPNQFQAERLAKIHLLLNRRQATAQFAVGVENMDLDPGDWVRFNSARYGDLTFVVIRRDPVFDIEGGRFHVRLSLRQRTADAYAWATVDEGPIVPYPRRPLPVPLIATVNNFTVSPTNFERADGKAAVPALRFAWSKPFDPAIVQVLIDFRVAGETNWQRIVDSTPDDGAMVYAGGILPGVDYEARATILCDPPRATSYTSIVSTTTNNVWTVPNAADIFDGVVSRAKLTQEFDGHIDDLEATSSAARDLALTVRDEMMGITGDASRRPGLMSGSVYDQLQDAALAQLNLLADFQSLRDEIRSAGIVERNGAVVIEGFDQTESRVAQVEATFDGVNAQIALKASTAYVNEAIAAEITFDALQRWDYTNTADGFVGVNATLTPGATALEIAGTATDAGLQITGLSLDVTGRYVVRFGVRRTAGAGWSGRLSWSGDGSFENTVAIEEPQTLSTVQTVAVDLSGEAAWSGTITDLRLVLGDDGDTFELEFLEVGAPGLDALLLSDLNARIALAELAIDGNAAAIALKASELDLTDAVNRLSTAEIAISANETAIGLKASQVAVDDLSAQMTSAQVDISGLESTISLITGQVDLVDISDTLDKLGVGLLDALVGLQQLNDDIDVKLANAAFVIKSDIVDESEARASAVTSLTASIGTTAAALNDLSIVTAEADAALAVRATTIEVAIDDPETGLQANASAITETRAEVQIVDGRVTAVASDLTELSTEIGDNEASISVLAASYDGLKVRYGVTGTINGSTGGFILTGVGKNDGTASYSMQFRVDRFSIVDAAGNYETSPFIFQAGTLYVRDAVIPQITSDKITVGSLSALSSNIGTITAGVIRSSDSKFKIDLSNRRLTVSD